jgi:hypothetical protein
MQSAPAVGSERERYRKTCESGEPGRPCGFRTDLAAPPCWDAREGAERPRRAYLSQFLVSPVRKRGLSPPSIGLERKAHFPFRLHPTIRPDGTLLSKDSWSAPHFEDDFANPMLTMFFGFSVSGYISSRLSEPGDPHAPSLKPRRKTSDGYLQPSDSLRSESPVLWLIAALFTWLVHPRASLRLWRIGPSSASRARAGRVYSVAVRWLSE